MTVVVNGGMSVVGSGKSCKTCGHRAHCGTPAYMNFKDYASDGGGIREVKICDCCQCSSCTSEKENKDLKNVIQTKQTKPNKT